MAISVRLRYSLIGYLTVFTLVIGEGVKRNDERCGYYRAVKGKLIMRCFVYECIDGRINVRLVLSVISVTSHPVRTVKVKFVEFKIIKTHMQYPILVRLSSIVSDTEYRTFERNTSADGIYPLFTLRK